MVKKKWPRGDFLTKLSWHLNTGPHDVYISDVSVVRTTRLCYGAVRDANLCFFLNITHNVYISLKSQNSMARILVGGPEGEHQNIHDKLVDRLKQEHEVNYVKNDGQGMFWELVKTPLVPAERRYNLIVYDSDLFYPGTTPEKKVECFEAATRIYLAAAQAPVLVLAEFYLAAQLRPAVEKAGFMQIDEPYRMEQVIHKVNELLGKHFP